MKLIILHLSDIHFKTNKSENQVTSRVEALSAAVASSDFEATHILIVVTGDIAYSGQEMEYDQGQSFFESLVNHLKAAGRFATIKIAVAPGNHDCDFSNQDREYMRGLVLDSQKTNGAAAQDKRAQAELLFPQLSFRKFAHAISGTPFDDLEATTTMRYESDTVQVHMYNTSISSRMKEIQGDLFVAVQQLSATKSDAKFVVAGFHHPYNWLEANNSREFRSHIERTADLILSGHEHAPNAFNKTNLLGLGTTTYFEGGVLQESSNPQKSEFNIFCADLSEETTQLFQYELNSEGQYATSRVGSIEPFLRNTNRLKNTFILTEGFSREFLNEAGAGFTTSRKGNLLLTDIFVPPNLLEISGAGGAKRIRNPISALKFLDHVKSSKQVLIAGDEQAGKTTLAKQFFLNLHQTDLVPLFVRAKRYQNIQFNQEKIREAMNSDLREQYEGIDPQLYWQLPAAKRVLVIDDAHLVSPRRKELKKFMTVVGKMFERIIAFSHTLSLTDDITAASVSELPFKDFDRYAIAEFGNVLREQLIEKWYEAAYDWSGDQDSMDRQIAQTKRRIDDAIGRNMLPSFPIFILILLQQIEAATPLETSTGAHGFLFESLITTALTRADTKVDLDTAYAFLGILAEEMFSKKQQYITESEFTALHQKFSFDTKQTLKQDRYERAFEQARILAKIDSKICFRYKYCYYYFAARYLNENLQMPETKIRLGILTDQVFKEEYANILMFLAYLSKRDATIVELVLKNARGLYEGAEEFDFAGHTAFVNELQKTLPTAELKNESAKQSRQKVNEQLDNEAGAKLLSEREVDLDEEERLNGQFKEAMQINAALKSIQILGQLLKSFPATLPGDKKKEIALVCYKLGLRTIGSFLKLADEHKASLVELFRQWLAPMKRPESSVEWEESAEKFLVYLLDLFTTGVVSRVASSVGVPTLGPLYAEIRQENPLLPFQIIDYAIQLEHFDGFPLKQLDVMLKGNDANIFPTLVLRRLTLSHFYRFPSAIGDKQVACQRLKIELQHLTALEARRS